MANNISDYYDNPFLKYFKSSSSSGTTPSFKPAAGSTNTNIAALPLSDLEEQKADLKENEQALGLLGIGQKALAGGRGFLSETLGFLSRPKSAIVGLGSGLLHQDDGNGDDTDDGAVDRFLAGLSGDRNYGAGDFGALKWSPNDSWLGRLGKAGAAFAIDTVSDPLTWVSGVGGVGTKAGRIGAEAIPGAARETLDNLANRGFFADPDAAAKAAAGTGPVKVDAPWGSPLADPATVPAFQRQLEGPAAGTGTTPTAPVPPFVPPMTPAPLYKQPLALPAGVGGKFTTPGSETVNAFTRTAEAVPATPVTEVQVPWHRSGGRLSQPPAPEPFGPTVQDRLPLSENVVDDAKVGDLEQRLGVAQRDTDLAPDNFGLSLQTSREVFNDAADMLKEPRANLSEEEALFGGHDDLGMLEDQTKHAYTMAGNARKDIARAQEKLLAEPEHREFWASEIMHNIEREDFWNRRAEFASNLRDDYVTRSANVELSDAPGSTPYRALQEREAQEYLDDIAGVRVEQQLYKRGLHPLQKKENALSTQLQDELAGKDVPWFDRHQDWDSPGVPAQPGTEQLTVPFDGGTAPVRRWSTPATETELAPHRKLADEWEERNWDRYDVNEKAVESRALALDRLGKVRSRMEDPTQDFNMSEFDAKAARAEKLQELQQSRAANISSNDANIRYMEQQLERPGDFDAADLRAISDNLAKHRRVNAIEKHNLAREAQELDDIYTRLTDPDAMFNMSPNTGNRARRIQHIAANYNRQRQLDTANDTLRQMDDGVHPTQLAVEESEAAHRTFADLSRKGNVHTDSFVSPRQDPLFGKAGDGAAVNPRTGDRYAGTLRADAKAARNPGTFPEMATPVDRPYDGPLTQAQEVQRQSLFDDMVAKNNELADKQAAGIDTFGTPADDAYRAAESRLNQFDRDMVNRPYPEGVTDPLPFNLPALRPRSEVAAIPKSKDWEFYKEPETVPEPGDLARTGDGDPNWEFAGDREDPNWDFHDDGSQDWHYIDREEPTINRTPPAAGGNGTVPPSTGGTGAGAADAVPDDVAGAAGKITREEFEEKLKYGFEEGWVKRKSRGGRQGVEKVVTDYLKGKGLTDEEMQSIATEIFNALPDEARGGLGIRVPFLGRDADGKITSAGKSASRYLFTTPGGGRLIDRLGLGRAADAYYDTLLRLRRSRAYRRVADNLNGQDGKDWGDYLRGDITFKQFAKAREGREALRDSRAEYAEALATTKTLAYALAKKVGLSNTTFRAALKEYTGRGEKADLKHLTEEQQEAVKQVHKAAFTTMNEPWQEFKYYAADTKLHAFDPDLTNVDDYQPRVWTKKTEEHFQKYGPFQPGEQHGPSYNPKVKRASDVLQEEEKKTGRKLTNLEANELYKKQGLDVEFETDPLVMMDKYVNAIGYKISRLKQVKTLMDGGVLLRIVNADSKEMHAKGYVQLGGKAAEGRTISHEAGTNTWVKEELQEPVSRWLSSVKPGNSDLAKFAENVLKPAYAFFKTTATVGRGPGYHARNILGGVGNNWLGGITVRDHGLMTQMMHEEAKARKTVAGLIRGDLRPDQVSAHLAEAYRKVQSRLRPGEVVTIQDAHDLVDAELEPTLSKIKVGGRAGNLHQERINMRKNRVGEDNILLQDLTEDQLRDAGLLSNDQNRFTLRPDLNPEDLSKTQKAFDKVLDNWWIRKNAGFARGSERWLRGSAYLGSARRFGSENEGLAAALNAKTIQYDYSDLSDFERKYLKGFAFPFYTFMRNNIPYQLQNLMKRPGYFTAIANAQQELANQFVKRDDNGNIDEANSYLPQWTTEKEGFLTDTLVPKAFRRLFDPLNQSKDAPLISMIESPANDLNNYFKVGEGTHGIDLGAFAGGLNPLLKEPVELWSGQDTFTGGTIQPTVLPGFLSGLGTGHDDDGNATVNGKFAQTAKNFLPPLGVLQNLASVGTQGERAVSNRSGFFTGLPLATSTERQQTGELITRNHRASDMIDQYTNANNIDDDEKAFLRKLIAKGTQPDGTIPDTYRAYLDQVISQLKASPIAKK